MCSEIRQRMQDHPGIVFRDGPAGRRAGLSAGPDLWEVIETLKGTGLAGEAAIAATAEWGVLSTAQVRAAVRYYGEFRGEIDERIDQNRRAAARGPAAWERAQEALACSCFWTRCIRRDGCEGGEPAEVVDSAATS